jgi:hypothetical protein
MLSIHNTTQHNITNYRLPPLIQEDLVKSLSDFTDSLDLSAEAKAHLVQGANEAAAQGIPPDLKAVQSRMDYLESTPLAFASQAQLVDMGKYIAYGRMDFLKKQVLDTHQKTGKDFAVLHADLTTLSIIAKYLERHVHNTPPSGTPTYYTLPPVIQNNLIENIRKQIDDNLNPSPALKEALLQNAHDAVHQGIPPDLKIAKDEADNLGKWLIFDRLDVLKKQVLDNHNETGKNFATLRRDFNVLSIIAKYLETTPEARTSPSTPEDAGRNSGAGGNGGNGGAGAWENSGTVPTST